jgi:hypothetical protein
VTNSLRRQYSLALDTLSGYAEDCITLLNPLTAPPQAAVTPGTQAPCLPDTTIDILQECARYADEKVASQIAILIGKFQVQQARLTGLLSRRSGKRLIEQEGTNSIIDAADLYARAVELLDYSRDIKETRRRATPDQLRRALRNCKIMENGHPAMVYINGLEQNPHQ